MTEIRFVRTHAFLFLFSLPLLLQAESPSSMENCPRGLHLLANFIK